MICEKCKHDLPNTHLNLNSKIVWCKVCVKEYNQLYYRQNKKKIKKYVNQKQKLLREKNLAVVNGIRANPCKDCGKQYHIICMDFDHVDPTTKSFNIAHGIFKYDIETLIREIAKCDLVCSNCHRIREHNRRRKNEDIEC